MQQDAHEFLNYLLNTIADLLQEEKSQERQQNGKLVQNGGGGGSDGGGGGGGGDGEGGKETQQTWVHEIFQGTLTNETRCLNCEAVSVTVTPANCTDTPDKISHFPAVCKNLSKDLFATLSMQ